MLTTPVSIPDPAKGNYRSGFAILKTDSLGALPKVSDADPRIASDHSRAPMFTPDGLAVSIRSAAKTMWIIYGCSRSMAERDVKFLSSLRNQSSFSTGRRMPNSFSSGGATLNRTFPSA